jgi:hypothetical protein
MKRLEIDSTTIQLATRIPQSLQRAIKLAALEDDTTLRDWVCAALEAYLAKLEANPVPIADEIDPQSGRVRTPRRARTLAGA